MSNRYPNLSSAPLISTDIETYDPELSSKGPSNYRKPRGHILGVAIDVGDFAEYYDYSNEHDRQYIKDVMALPAPKIGHSLLYDVDWLQSEGIGVNGKLIDVMIAEALIDNEKESYALDSIGRDYLQQTKEDTEIILALNKLGITPTKSRPAQDYLHMLDHDTIRPYALQDVHIPLGAWPRMERLLEHHSLDKLFDLESELIRVLLYMRQIGVPYDVDVSEQCTAKINEIYLDTKRRLKEDYGGVNVNSSQQVAYIFDKVGIPYPYTDKGKGNPSFTREYLEQLIEQEELEHYSNVDYFPSLVHNARRLGKSERDYISGIRNNYLCADGATIRCSFHQTRDANNFGTVSGRFSSSKPNLQQITSAERDDFLGGLCRRPFIPLPEHDWVKIDYSQIEYRFMAHYAKGPGSSEIRRSYNDNPDTDYHQYIVDLTGLDRPVAKNFNFGLAFGMGIGKMRRIYGWDEYKAYEMQETYHDNVPFVKYTMNDVGNVAKRRGYIKTILGRIAKLPDKRKAYVMFNRLIQGSAADLIKRAMVDIYKSGLLNYVSMHLTVHDENDFSIPKGAKQNELISELKHIMETALPLRVPVIAEASIGPNWGDVEKIDNLEQGRLGL